MPFVYGLALLRADLTTEIPWRGIIYRILPDKKIYMTGYTRWRPAATADNSMDLGALPATTTIASAPSDVQEVLAT